MPPEPDDPKPAATDTETTGGAQATVPDTIEPDTIEPDTIEIDAVPLLIAQEYNPTEDREKARSNIALILVCTLVGVIAIALLFAWVEVPGKRSVTLYEVLKIVFAPLVGLVGAATGFYYGGKSK